MCIDLFDLLEHVDISTVHNSRMNCKNAKS